MQTPLHVSHQANDFQNDLLEARTGSVAALGRVLDQFRPYLLRIANNAKAIPTRVVTRPTTIANATVFQATPQ